MEAHVKGLIEEQQRAEEEQASSDWQSVIVTERLQLAADMMRADAKGPLDRARNGLGRRSPGSPLVR